MNLYMYKGMQIRKIQNLSDFYNHLYPSGFVNGINPLGLNHIIPIQVILSKISEEFFF